MTEIGDNIVAVDGDVFKQHVARISAKAIAKEHASAELKDARQSAKAAGITLGSMDEAIKRAKMSRDELIQQEAEVSTYAKWLGAVEVGTQIDWLQHNAPSVTDMEKAEGAGEMAGLTGLDPSGGAYAPGSQQYNKWMEGWHRGSKVFQDESAASGVEPLGPEDNDETEPDAETPALVHTETGDVQPFDPDEEEAGDRPLEEDQALFQEGWDASKLGKAQSECPYKPGDERRGMWMEGFDGERDSRE